MKVTVKLHNSDELTYEQATYVEQDKYSIYIHGKDNHILAILNKGDIKMLRTDETPE